MVSLAQPPAHRAWAVLEPACANAPFLQSFVRRWGGAHHLTGVEFDSSISRDIGLPRARIVFADYLLWQPAERFDLILGNPPYGIIGDASHYPIHGLLAAKQQYKKQFHTWCGKYNVYGLFVEHSVRLLKPGGHLVFVIPSTWMLLDDFAPLRRFLSEQGCLDVYYMGRAFPGVSVVAVVLHFCKGDVRHRARLYDRNGALAVEERDYYGDLLCFRNGETRELESQCRWRMSDLFEIRFAARSPECKRSPWVSRHREDGMVPLLTGRNLKPGWIDYETNHSGLWMRREDAPRLRTFYAQPHLVVAHTRGARVVAAYDERCFPWREEFHLVPRRLVDAPRVAAYLNSEGVQGYVATLYRDLTPHLTRTQLCRLPVPEELVGDVGAKRHVQLLLPAGRLARSASRAGLSRPGDLAPDGTGWNIDGGDHREETPYLRLHSV